VKLPSLLGKMLGTIFPVFIYFLSPILAVSLDQSNNQTNSTEIKLRNLTLPISTQSEDKSNLISVQSPKDDVRTVDILKQGPTSTNVHPLLKASYFVVPPYFVAQTQLQTPYIAGPRSLPFNYYSQAPQKTLVQPQTYFAHSNLPKTYYSPQEAFFRLFNPFMLPSSPDLTCVGVACNQNNVGGFSGVTTCVGGKCNQDNFRKKRSPEAQFGGFGIMENFKDFNQNFESLKFGGFQKCIGSQCNQNNLDGLNQQQKCFGAQCNQRNMNSIGQEQNCQGSECNQANKESLGQKQNCLGSQCNQKNEVSTGGKLLTPPGSIGSLVSFDGFHDNFQFGTKQNCIGSQCNQNNVDVAGQEQNCQGSDCNQNNEGSLKLMNLGHVGNLESLSNSNFGNEFLFGQKQNCIGSKCNQNNLEGLLQKQNCIGSQCNQHNMEGLGQKQQCLGSQCNQNNLEGVGQAQTCQGSRCNQNNVG